MTDILDNGFTAAILTVGGSATGTLEFVGDHDWFRIELVAGQAVTVTLDGFGLNAVSDTYLRIRDASGNVIAENDDAGQSLNSLAKFAAATTGVYYIDVGSWGDRYVGEYQVSVDLFVPPPVGTNDQIADQLVNGYWEGASRHFNVTSGGSLSVNLSALTAEGQYLARNALAVWTDVVGVNFVEVATGGQITFDDDEEGSHAGSISSGGITSSASVNVSADWLTDHGTSLNSFTFQTYIHEIGHALGLGHAGDYNLSASNSLDALFSNDSWAVSVMSYLNQEQCAFYADQGFTQSYTLTPMVADIIAVGRLYGLSTTTRTGDTVYGFNSTADNALFDARQFTNVAYTIYDSAGVDTLNYSGFSAGQLINLNPETFSDIGGLVGNVSIARGVVIENAVGGGGDDSIFGNGADNRMTGGAGADIFILDNRGETGFDRITDFGSDDQIWTTVRLAETGRNGRIVFDADRELNLFGTSEVQVRNGGQVIDKLDYAGSVTVDGTTYFTYDSLGRRQRDDNGRHDERLDHRDFHNRGSSEHNVGQVFHSAAFSGKAGELHGQSANHEHFVAGDVNGGGVADLWSNHGAVQVGSGDFFL